MRKIICISLFLSCALSSWAEWRYVGDVNNDKKLTISDVAVLVNIILGNSEMPKDLTLYDVNGDKKLDKSDVEELVHILVGAKDPTKIWIPETVSVGSNDKPFD